MERPEPSPLLFVTVTVMEVIDYQLRRFTMGVTVCE